MKKLMWTVFNTKTKMPVAVFTNRQMARLFNTQLKENNGPFWSVRKEASK